ncbi:MAG TPA: hypothetical protein VK935_13205 [Actinomycetospora sp.]|nr:hypothetical protein [Actinomycetospora sp.]
MLEQPEQRRRRRGTPPSGAPDAGRPDVLRGPSRHHLAAFAS